LNYESIHIQGVFGFGIVNTSFVIFYRIFYLYQS